MENQTETQDKTSLRSKKSSESTWSSIECQILSYKVTTWREATRRDTLQIGKIITEDADMFFGSADLSTLIEVSLYNYVLENSKNDIIAYVCFNFYPNIVALPPEGWRDWMKFHYQLTSITYENSIFIHYMAWDLRYDPINLKDVLLEVFHSTRNLEYICVVAPPIAKCTFDNILSNFFTRVLPSQNVSSGKTQSVYVCNRSNILEPSSFRLAMPEDNDDLMEILAVTHPEIQRKFGEYFVAQSLLDPNNTNSMIVIDQNNKSVGLMWLNGNVDINLANQNFHVLPFQSLKKHHPTFRVVRKTYLEIIKKESATFFESLNIPNDVNIGALCNCDNAEEGSEDSVEEISFQGSRDSISSESLKYIYKLLGKKSEADSVPVILGDPTYIEWPDLDQGFTDKYHYAEKVEESVYEKDAPSNAFALRLCGLHPDLDERMMINLLKAAFDVYPDKNYCLMSLPTSANIPRILSYFTRVIPRAQCITNESLYVAHKNCIFGKTRVSRITGCDLEEIKRMIKYNTHDEIKPAKDMMKLIRHSLVSTQKEYDALVIRSAGTIVGLTILTLCDNVHLLRRYFRIDDYADFGLLCQPQHHGKILYLYINPLFEMASPFIFREICRITGYHSLYYSVGKPDDLNLYNNLLSEMYPVRPRRTFNNPCLDEFPNIEVPEALKAELEPIPLFYQNVQLSTKQRKNVDLRIVLVGFSAISKSFLECLLYKRRFQGLKFTNLTVIVPPGVVEADSVKCEKECLLFNNLPIFYPEYMKRLEFRTWVNFVSGEFTEINRTSKYVILDYKEKVKYDILIFFSPVIFGLPTTAWNEKVFPHNVAIINNALDAHVLKYKLNILKQTFQDGFSVIVYGCVLMAWACVNYLLNHNIKGKNIYFVILNDITFELTSINMDDPIVEEKCFEELQKAKVNIYKDYRFVSWEMNDNNVVKSIYFESKFHCVHLNCSFFISYYKKRFTTKQIKVIKHSGLVVDGQLVIDGQYRTNDPYIYAAGSVTKYVKVLYAEKFRQMYYNLHEVASKLANQIAKDLIDTKTSKEAMDKRKKLCFGVPQFRKPILTEYVLPGNLYYACLVKPGYKLPFEITKALDHYGEDLVTGQEDSSETEGYCRIRINRKGFIESITCLKKEKVGVEFLFRIYGLHESLVGHMKKKYEIGEIKDLFKFIRCACIIPLIHDRFQSLRRTNEVIYLQHLAQIPGVNEILKQLSQGKKRVLSKCERSALKAYVSDERCVKEIEENLVKFLESDPDSFFMFATPAKMDQKFNLNKCVT